MATVIAYKIYNGTQWVELALKNDIPTQPTASYSSGLKLTTGNEIYVPTATSSQNGVCRIKAGDDIEVSYSNGEITVSRKHKYLHLVRLEGYGSTTDNIFVVTFMYYSDINLGSTSASVVLNRLVSKFGSGVEIPCNGSLKSTYWVSGTTPLLNIIAISVTDSNIYFRNTVTAQGTSSGSITSTFALSRSAVKTAVDVIVTES